MSGIVPIWLEKLLGIEPAGPGEGTLWSLENTWSWAPWFTLLFAIGAIGWVFYSYTSQGSGKRARGVLVTLRLAAILLVMLMLAEFTLSLRRTGLPTVAILVDDSASMEIDDPYSDARLKELVASRIQRAGLEGNSRFNLAKALLLDDKTDLLSAIAKRYRLKMYLVSSAARAQSGSLAELQDALRAARALGEHSRLGAGLRQVLADLRGTPPAAVILLSDGVNTDGPSLADAANYARRKGVPLLTVGLGSEQKLIDLELSDVLVDEIVFADDVVDFQFKLTGHGLTRKSVAVTLREKGNPAVLAQLNVTIDDGKPQLLHLPFRPEKVGEFEYVLEAEPLGEETQTENNRQSRLVSVRKEQIKVLLVQAYPNYEFRYLKNMLERDNSIELKTVLQEADLEYAELDNTALRVFPVRREELFAYDVVVFGDVNPDYLSTSGLANLHDFVEKKGGGVAFISGPQFMPAAYRNTPIEPLFPIAIPHDASGGAGNESMDEFIVQPTELGLASPQMQLGDQPGETANLWRNLHPLHWAYSGATAKPTARVLAEHPMRLGSDGRAVPLFLMQYVGAGKVLFHATDETWLWRYRVGDVFFARYWVQAIRYLSRSKLLGQNHAVEISSDRREYRRGQAVRLRARFIDERVAPAADDGVTLVLEREGQPHRRVQLQRNPTNRGVFEATASEMVDGSYHVWLAEPAVEGNVPAADLVVIAPPGEMEHLQMDSGELKQAAETTHGKFYRVNDVGRLLTDLPPGHQVPIESLPPVPLWNRWWVLALFLGLVVSEWILRKQQGMI
ncbi:MAG TPA: VWA domain-containing protein [Pirellulales bacterium]|jgi:uncharacterized membrane protein|nr:VWA domain-containing protein [Pirellulales bacterium]